MSNDIKLHMADADGVDQVSVAIVINSDIAARSLSSANYTYYDAVVARITAISDARGGPMGGGTWVRLTGLLFADFRRANGELAQPGEQDYG